MSTGDTGRAAGGGTSGMWRRDSVRGPDRPRLLGPDRTRPDRSRAPGTGTGAGAVSRRHGARNTAGRRVPRLTVRALTVRALTVRALTRWDRARDTADGRSGRGYRPTRDASRGGLRRWVGVRHGVTG
ncbi:hypothetical protein [Virgisporangium ochraceum]|uniref:Uncharacterized protein n=1 Tax=Virgisporangium ochraceum TaxID=65505 RepID=A0A8J4A5I8_9ACTN|nr:hypothetical protein [Virgisporangium ochraceum]GIJ74220.1 hypothetical protein Voc01_091370 [Virgisporangium ochraceum]